MGASESTGRLNGTEREEESTGAAAIAIAVTAGVAAAWGISRMLSNNREIDTEEEDAERTTRSRTHGMEPSLPNPRIRSYTRYTDEGSNRNEYVQYAIPEGNSTTKSTIWLPPPPGGFKMNTDGGFYPNEGQYSDGFGPKDAVERPSACAGILRNHRGECIKAFRQLIFVNGSLEAEFFGIFKGLELLVELGLKGAILESDSQQAVLWINGDKDPKKKMTHCEEMIKNCRTLKTDNSIEILHIARSANKCADALACLVLKEPKHYVQFDLPDKVKKLVDEDNTAYRSSRLKSGALLM